MPGSLLSMVLSEDHALLESSLARIRLSAMRNDLVRELLLPALHLANRKVFDVLKTMAPRMTRPVEKIFSDEPPVPLHLAITRNDLASVRALIDSGADVNAANTLGQPALHLACALPHFPLEGIEQLLRAGADTNGENCRGYTPLLIASVMKRPSVMQKLMTYGADIHQTTNSSETSLSLVLFQVPSFLPFLPVQIPEHFNYIIPMQSCDDRPLRCAEMLLEAGVKLQREKHRGRPLLHRVILKFPETKGNRVLSMLLAFGADVNEGDSLKRRTPLFPAALRAHVKTMALLLDHGADIKATCKDGGTVLHYLASLRFVSRLSTTITFLIDHGADLCALNNDYCTFLDIMVSHTAYVAVLLTVIGKGYYPREVRTSERSSFQADICRVEPCLAATPLLRTLYSGNTDAAIFLRDIGFLTGTDILWLSGCSDVKKILPASSQETYNRMVAGPCSLRLISFVRVSDLLGSTSDRKVKVQKLGLPVALQDQLLFTRRGF